MHRISPREALAQAELAAADVTFHDLVREMIRQRDKLMRWVEAAGRVPQAMAQLSQALDVGPDRTVPKIEKEISETNLSPRPNRRNGRR